MVNAMRRCDKPIVFVLNGKVAGAEIGLALAVDIVIAADNADFVPAFGTIGAMPDTATLYFLAQNIGLNRAREVILLNKVPSAGEVERIGIYNKVVPRDHLADEARVAADRLTSGPTLVNALAKKALRDAIRLPFDAFMDLESLSMAFLITTHDQVEGIQAFKERRAPKFRDK
jgi:2-(1,2-epoxy-1,2-dihydrophenyl)acetyl-CoA isomerase